MIYITYDVVLQSRQVCICDHAGDPRIALLNINISVRNVMKQRRVGRQTYIRPIPKKERQRDWKLGTRKVTHRKDSR